jgi:hypothetical protein
VHLLDKYNKIFFVFGQHLAVALVTRCTASDSLFFYVTEKNILDT